jgi:very-short-patch-repair endonuclease
LIFWFIKNSNKQPIIAFEVDGSKFHKRDSDQEKRDIMKDAVFKLNDLKLYRYKTKRSKDERNSMIEQIKVSLENIKKSRVETISKY